MIEPTQKDLWRPVTYTGNRHYGGPDEYGVLKNFNEQFVFVTFAGQIHARAVRREDLEWTEGKP